MLPLQLKLLGSFEARLGTGNPVILARRKSQALLAYLALSPGQIHLRDKLAALLWGDSTDERARQSLRQALLTIKQSLPSQAGEIVHVESDTVALNAAAVHVDVAVFEGLLKRGTPEALAEACTLYSGELLEGLSVQEAPFEDWLMTQRERLRELAVEALARLLAHQMAHGSNEQAVHIAARLLSLDPLQESVHRALMQLYARQGRRGAALRQYQVCVGIMQRELGVEPEEKTRALYQEILERLPPADITAVATAASLAPLGSDFGAVMLVPDTPLVGRAAERAALLEAWDQVRQRRGQTVAILGEAGIGKSRLASDLITEVLGHGGRVLLGRAHDSEQILPFGPWVDAFRVGRVMQELAVERVANAFWVAELARLFPEISVTTREVTDPEDYGRLFEAIAHAIGHLVTRQPLLLILEDVHWADEMTLRLLAFVSRRVSDWPVLLLATARSEHFIDMPILGRTFAELSRETRFLSLSLSPLSAPDTVTLVGTLCRVGTDDPTVQRLGEQIWRASEGNPFMVVETMRARDDEKASSPEELRTPIRVRDVIASRFARLSERGRELVALASVIGRDFDFVLLDRAAGLGTRAAAEGVEELVGRRILHAVGERLDFTHDRIREVAYDQLIAPRQRLLHAAVANAIEDVYGDDLESHCVALGRHCRRAGLWEKALTYLHQAGLVAARHAAHRHAITCFEQALDVMRRLPNRRDLLEQAIHLRFALRNSCVAVGEIGQVPAHLREAAAAAETLEDRLRLGWVLAYETSSHFLLGENDKSLEAGQRAVALAAELAEPKLRIAAHLFCGQTCHAVGLYQRGANLLRQSIESFESELTDRGDKPAQQIYSRAALTCCLAELGEFDEGLARGAEAVRLAETAERSYALGHACLALGLLHLRRGDCARAVAVLQSGVARCQRQDAPLLLAALGCLLGYGYALSGDSAKAIPLCDESVHVLSPFGGDSLCASLIGEAYLLEGRVEEAAAWARHALTVTRGRAERGHEAWALRLLADTACHRASAEAEVAYRDALARAEELGMMPLRGHCHLGRGCLRSRTGDHDGARADLSAAIDLFRAMDMALWLPDAEAELARLA